MNEADNDALRIFFQKYNLNRYIAGEITTQYIDDGQSMVDTLYTTYITAEMKNGLPYSLHVATTDQDPYVTIADTTVVGAETDTLMVILTNNNISQLSSDANLNDYTATKVTLTLYMR